MSTPIRLGVVSFAHDHVNTYLETIADLDDARCIAAWDDDAARGEAACARHGLAWEPDLAALLARDDIDAVFVTSPTSQHAAHCIAAASAGKHILLQKPMALTIADCDAIIAAVDAARVKLSMCYQMRADPVNIAIKALLDEGAIGNVAVARRRHAIDALLNPGFARPGNWHIDPAQNMGMFMDDASHAADWFLWMFGRPVSVMAEIDNVVTDIAPDDNGVAIFRFARGEIGVLLNSSTQLAALSTTEIYGDAGTIQHNFGDQAASKLPRPPGVAALSIYRAGAAGWEDLGLDANRPHGDRIRAVPRPLIDFLRGDGPPLATAEDGKICVEMILAAYESARTGRRVLIV